MARENRSRDNNTERTTPLGWQCYGPSLFLLFSRYTFRYEHKRFRGTKIKTVLYNRFFYTKNSRLVIRAGVVIVATWWENKRRLFGNFDFENEIKNEIKKKRRVMIKTDISEGNVCTKISTVWHDLCWLWWSTVMESILGQTTRETDHTSEIYGKKVKIKKNQYFLKWFWCIIQTYIFIFIIFNMIWKRTYLAFKINI